MLKYAAPTINETSTLLKSIPATAFDLNFFGHGVVTEARNYYTIGDDGSVVIVQVAYSTIGIRSSVQVTAFYCNPTKAINVMESDSFSASKMKLTNNNLSVAVDGLLNIEYNADADVTTIVYASQNRDSGIFLRFVCRYVVTPFQFNDGSVFFGLHEDEGSVHTKFCAKNRISGKIGLGFFADRHAFEGTGMIFQVSQSMKPYNAMNRTWFGFFVSHDKQYTVAFIDVEAPKQYGNLHYQNGYVVSGDAVLALSIDVAAHSTEFEECSQSNYRIPTNFTYVLRGKTMDGRKYEATLHVSKCNVVGVVDVLGKLSTVIRMLIQTFVAKPFLYQWLDEAQLTLRIENEPEIVVKGVMHHEHCILNA